MYKQSAGKNGEGGALFFSRNIDRGCVETTTLSGQVFWLVPSSAAFPFRMSQNSGLQWPKV